MTSEEERSQQQQDHPQTATAAATTEIEVNFRLDSEGRTQPTRPPTATGAAASSTTGNAASDGAAAPLDYESKTARVRFEYCCADAGGDDNGAGDDARTAGRASEREITGIVDELLLDCEVSCRLAHRLEEPCLPLLGWLVRCDDHCPIFSFPILSTVLVSSLLTDIFSSSLCSLAINRPTTLERISMLRYRIAA